MNFLRRILNVFRKKKERIVLTYDPSSPMGIAIDINELDKFDIEGSSDAGMSELIKALKKIGYKGTVIFPELRPKIAIDVQADFIPPRAEKIMSTEFGLRRNPKKYVVKGQSPCAETYAAYGCSISSTPNKDYIDLLVKRGYVLPR